MVAQEPFFYTVLTPFEPKKYYCINWRKISTEVREREREWETHLGFFYFVFVLADTVGVIINWVDNLNKMGR